jgi:[CysO sulfur-carrier protein]-S-L-cysteine hydrolase
MNLQLHPDQLEFLATHLARAGRYEIGGVLVGEHLAENLFRVADLSFQRSTGTESCFVRRPEEHDAFLASFFERTGDDFRRFNYLGEWHSHPSFPACASTIDHRAMQIIVEDGPTAPLFAVLIVARLADDGGIELGATAYRRASAICPVTVQVVPRPRHDSAKKPLSWWRRIISRRSPEIKLVRSDERIVRERRNGVIIGDGREGEI